jgi:hypothetical protein
MSVLPIAPLPAATGSAPLPTSPGTNDAMSFDAHVVVASQKPVTCLANGPSPAGSHFGNQSEAQLRSAGTAANKAVERAIDKTRGGEMAEADRQDPDIGGSAGDSGKAVPAKTSLVAKPIADTAATPTTPEEFPASSRKRAVATSPQRAVATSPQRAVATTKPSARHVSGKGDLADPTPQTTTMTAGVPEIGSPEMAASRALPKTSAAPSPGSGTPGLAGSDRTTETAPAARDPTVPEARTDRRDRGSHGRGDVGARATAPLGREQIGFPLDPHNPPESFSHHLASLSQDAPLSTATPGRNGEMATAPETGQAPLGQTGSGTPLSTPYGDAIQSGGTRQPDLSAQVSAPLVRLASAVDGSSRVQVSMHPRDLGSVEIHLDRRSDGSVSVTVAASEPGTLRSLIADQAHLHAALDAASVPSAERHFTFELTAPAGDKPQHSETDQGSQNGAGQNAAGQNGPGSGSGRDDGGRRQVRGEDMMAGSGRPLSRAGLTDDRARAPSFAAARSGSYRIAINITA